MKKMLSLLFFLTTGMMHGWGGKELKDGKGINFFGMIETHDGQEWDIQNIAIGRDRSEARHKSITMYDKPQIDTQEEGGKRILSKAPGTLSYSEIDLNEIKEINIAPNPIIWLYKKQGARYGIEYIEVTITHKDGKQSPFLIELGREDLPKKTKVFCSIRHTKDNQKTPVIPTENKDDLFCKGIKMDELEEKGIPFQAIKKLTIQGFCHQIVVNSQ